MGRLSRCPTPSASGATIFYGVQSIRNISDVATNPPNLHSDSSKSSPITTYNRSDIRSVLSSSTANVTQKDTNIKDILDIRGISTVQTVINLSKDILATFKTVPYVQVVASLVQQIITVSNEVQGNKDRSKELVSKVVTYARVVFEALMGLQGQETKGLEEDLLQIANVLQSIYEVLQYLSSPRSMSLFNRVVYRDDIASKLAAEDRRLDVIITAFQLKSSIVIRSSGESSRSVKDVRLLLAHPALPTRQAVALRAKPQIFFGRNNEVNIIVNTLLHDSDEHDSEKDYPTRRLCILGPGGIGKTTLALSVMHHEAIGRKFQGRRFFVPCEAAASPELFLDQLCLSLGIPMENAKEMGFRLILQHLGKVSCLIILDNFETTWEPMDTRPEMEAILSEITSLSTVFLIVTMRGTQRPAGTLWYTGLSPLRPIDMGSAISIFKAICQKEDRYSIDLIRAVDRVPLAVTLLANLASVDGETTEALWARWKEESILMVENGQDRLNSLETSVQLSLSSPRMLRDRDAMSFLSIISLLPDGLSSETFVACEKGLTEIQSVKKAVSILRQNALVYEDGDKDLRVLNPVRLFMLARHPPTTGSRSFISDYLVNLASQGNQYDDAKIRKRLQREVNNIEAILLDVLETTNEAGLPAVVDATVKFCHFTYASGRRSTKALAFAIDRLESVKTSFKVTLELPGPMLPTQKWAWQKALTGFSKGKLEKERMSAGLAKSSTSGIDPTLKLRADCLGCLGQLLSRQSEIDSAQEKFLMAKELHKKAGDEAGRAYDLLNLGLLLSVKSKTSDAALNAFSEAGDLHKKLGDKVGLAHDLMGAGHVYRDTCKSSQAERQFNLALELLIEAGNEVGQAAVLNGLGTIMLSLSKCTEAEKFFMDATRLCINIGDLVAEAENLAGLAVTYLLRSRFAEALQTIQKAIGLREPFVDPDHLHILGRVYIAMGQLDQAKSLLSRSLSMHEDTGDSRGQADNLMYLSFIEFDQNHSQEARKMAVKAIRLQDNTIVKADIKLLMCMVDIRQLRLLRADIRLATAMENYADTGCILGRAQCLQLQGIVKFRRKNFKIAMKYLQEALSLHSEVGNVQGQADDLNKICEVLLYQGYLEEPMKLISEALALHIRIGDKTGQADDLCVQGSIFLAQGRLSDAEMTMRQALEMHQESGSVYGIARDYAYLSDIIWKQQTQQGEEEVEVRQADDCFAYIRQALALFRKLGAAREFHDCREQKRRMMEKKPLVTEYLTLPYWVTTSDEEYEDQYTHISYADDSDSCYTDQSN